MESEISCNDLVVSIECPLAKKNVSNHEIFCNPTSEMLAVKSEKEACSLENEQVFNDLHEKQIKKSVSFSNPLCIVYSSNDQVASTANNNLPGIRCSNNIIPARNITSLTANPAKDLKSTDGIFSQSRMAKVVLEKLPLSLIHCESTNNICEDVCQKVYSTAVNSCNSISHLPCDEESLKNVTNSINSKSYRHADDVSASVLKEPKKPVRELKVMLQRLPNNLIRVLTDSLNSNIAGVATSSEISSGAALVRNSKNRDLSENKLRANQKAETCKRRRLKSAQIVSSKRKHTLKLSSEATNCSSQQPAVNTPVEKLPLSSFSRSSEDVVGHEFEMNTEQNKEDEKRPRACPATRSCASQKLLSKIQVLENQDCFIGLSNNVPLVQLERVDLPVPVIGSGKKLRDVDSKRNQNSPSLIQVLNHNSLSKLGIITPTKSLSNALSLHDSQDYCNLFRKRLCVHLERLDLNLKDAPEQNVSIKSNVCCSPLHSKRKNPKKRMFPCLKKKLKSKSKSKSQQNKNGLQISSHFEMRKNHPCPETSKNLDCSNVIKINDNVTGVDFLSPYPLIVDYEVPSVSSFEVVSQNESLLPKKINSLTNYRSLPSKQDLLSLSISNCKRLILHSNSVKKTLNKRAKQKNHPIRDRDASSDSSTSDGIPLSSLITAGFATTLPGSLNGNLNRKSYQCARNLSCATDDCSREENYPVSNQLKGDFESTSFLRSLTVNRKEVHKKKQSSCFKSTLSNVLMDHCYNRKHNVTRNVESLPERIHVDHSYTTQIKTDHSYHLPLNPSYAPAESQIIGPDFQTLLSNTLQLPSGKSVKQKKIDVLKIKKRTEKQNTDLSSKLKNSGKGTLKKKSSRKTKKVTKKCLREKQAEIYDLIAKYLRRQIKSKSSKKKIKKNKKHKSYNLNEQSKERQFQFANTIAKPDCDAVLASNSSNANMSDDSENCFSNKILSLNENVEDWGLPHILDIKVEPESDDSNTECGSRGANMHGQSGKILTLNENTKKRQLQAQSLSIKVEPESDDITVHEFDSRNTAVHDQSECCLPRETSLPLVIKVEPESDFSIDSADEFESRNSDIIAEELDSRSTNMHGQRENCSPGEILTPSENTDETELLGQSLIVEIEPETDCIARYEFDLSESSMHDQSESCFSVNPSTPSEPTEETQLQCLDINFEPESDYSTDTADELNSRHTEMLVKNGNPFGAGNSVSLGASRPAPVLPNKNINSKDKKKSVDKYRLGFLSRNKSLRIYNKCFASERLLLSNSKMKKKQKQELKKLFKNLNKVCHVKKV